MSSMRWGAFAKATGLMGAFLSISVNVVATGICPELTEASAKLIAKKSSVSERQDKLRDAETVGAQTLDLQDQLSDIRSTIFENLVSERNRLRVAMDEKQRALQARHQSRQADLAKERTLVVSQTANALAARETKYRALPAKSPRVTALERQESAAAKRLEELIDEKRVVMAELRSGLFCSVCSGSKSEIERNEKRSFEAHLAWARGVAVMKPEKLNQREAEFDRKIAEQSAIQTAKRQESKIEQEQYANMLNDERAAIEQLRKDRATRIAAVDQKIQKATETAALEMVAHNTVVREGENLANERESARVVREREIDAAIAARTVAYSRKVDVLRLALKQVEEERQALEREFDAAATACRALVAETHGQSLAAAVRQRQQVQSTREQWMAASYQHVRVQEVARRAAFEARTLVPPATEPSNIQALADEFRQTVAKTVSSLFRKELRSRDLLGLRESSYFRHLPDDTRDKIESDVQTFTSGTNIVRAVIRDSLGRVRSGSTSALLYNAFGLGNGVAPDLAVAIENARPSIVGTVKRKLMPTIQALAVEQIVDARERQENRIFDQQERVAERGAARVWTSMGNLLKHGESLIDTTHDAMNTFLISSGLQDDEAQ